VIRTVNKFDFQLVMNETLNKRPLMFVTGSVCLLLTVVESVVWICPHCTGQLYSLE